MGSPSIFSGRRTKLLTADGVLLSSGRTVDYDGDVNHITNGHLEINSTGWGTFDDGAVSTPVDLTGGAPSQVTAARITASPLSGQGSFEIVKAAADAQGEGVNYGAISVPLGYRGQQHVVGFTYRVTAGSITLGDVRFYLYDITNSALITVTGNDISGTSGLARGVATIPATCTSARFGLMFRTTSTTAATIVIDDVYLSPSVSPTSFGNGLASVAPGATISTNYTVVAGDDGRTLNIDTSAAAVTVTLPAPSAGFKVTIKDYKGTAASFPITIARNGTTEKIDNAATNDTITENYRAVSLVSDGTDWYRVAVFTGSAAAAGRGLWGGGSSSSNVIDYINMSSTGNASDFGDLTVGRSLVAGCSSSTRGVFGGGNDGAASNVMDYVTIATAGNATDFGDLTVARQAMGGLASSTRGVFGGQGGGNTIDYITIASTGNATDFGDLTTNRNYCAGLSSTTRGVFGGGDSGGGVNVIDYITIATPGNATDFGDLTVARFGPAGASSSTRGLFAGGFSAIQDNVIDYITIASTGNATDFGDLTVGRSEVAGVSNSVRAMFGGGTTGSVSNVIDYVTIASTGNATDFGDLTVARSYPGSCSDSHGGL